MGPPVNSESGAIHPSVGLGGAGGRRGAVAGLVAGACVSACLLPGEPSEAERVVFHLDFAQPYRVPIGGVATPPIFTSVRGTHAKEGHYRLEPTGIVSVDSSGRQLRGVRRGTDSVRVVYQTAIGSPDTSFAVRVVVASISVILPQELYVVVQLDQEGYPVSEPRFRRLGQTAQLTAVALDANGAEVPGVSFTWSSSVPQVATVSPLGLVTAVDEGTVTITAEADSVTGFAAVQVTQTAAAAVQISPELDTLRTVRRFTLFEALAFDSSNSVLRPVKIRWSSMNGAVATVDSTGVATATGPGTAQIIARVGQATDTATLVVAQVVRFLFVPPLFTLTAIGDTTRIVAQAVDSGGTAIPSPVINWSASDTTIADVDPTGLARAVRNGAVVITASSGSQTAFATVVVRQEVSSVRFVDDIVALTGEGDTARPAIVALDRNGYVVDRPRLTWRSRLDVVATVDSTGLATAHSDGATHVTASSSTDAAMISDTMTVTVTGAPQELIAFESQRGIEVVRTDGSLRSLLMSNGPPDCYYYYGFSPCWVLTQPAWSPNGDRLAFTWGDLTANTDVYTAKPDGSDTVNVSKSPAPTDGDAAAWSPDGTKIAFTSRDQQGNIQIWVANADGSNPIRLTQQGGVHPTWSADGTRIAFERGGEIYVIGTNGTAEVRLTNNGGQPSWSPDGSRLAFVSNRDGGEDIWVMNSDGSAADNLTGSLRPANARESGPAWSPDGSQIAFTSAVDRGCDYYYGCDREPYHLFVIPVDGTGLRQLTTGAEDEGAPSWRLVAPLQAPRTGGQPPHRAQRGEHP